MNAYGYAKFAQVLACQARVAGMMAENLHRQECGESIAYGEEHFFAEAKTMEDLSMEIQQDGWRPD